MLIINEKFIEVGKSIYFDGRFSDSGVEILAQENDMFLFRNWSKWQGDSDRYTVVSKQWVVEWLMEHGSHHPDRAINALREIGCEIQADQLTTDDEGAVVSVG